MTKKDYEAIARAISWSYDVSQNIEQFAGINTTKQMLIKTLQEQNARFDELKFLNACRQAQDRALDRLGEQLYGSKDLLEKAESGASGLTLEEQIAEEL